MHPNDTQHNTHGILAVLSAYSMWGILPLYWKALTLVPSSEIICHRIVWSFLFSLSLLIYQKKLAGFLQSLKNFCLLRTFFATALLLGSNWLVYIWAVNSGHIVEASLGYFINPLIAIFLGVIFLKERLRPGQWLALFIAFTGVIYLSFSHGHFPWIGLTLAITFALYSLLRKTASLHSLEGFVFEIGLLSLPACATLFFFAQQGQAHLLTSGPRITLLLIGAGLVTALPLLLFVFGAQKITMTAIGLMQYLAPTLQFLIGLLIYKEPFPPEKLIGFSIIWMALTVYTVENIHQRIQQKNRLRRKEQMNRMG